MSTGPPKYTLSSSCASDSSSGKTRETGIRVGLLMMTPAGDGPIWFITSTIESLKLGSLSSARATSKIVLNGFALSAEADHATAHSANNAQRAACQCGLHGRPQRCPRARPAPVVDKRTHPSAVIAGDHPFGDFGSNCLDFRKRDSPASPHRFEQVERGWFIEREAGNAVRPLDSGAQRDAPTVGVADKMHFAIGAIDDFDRPRGLICQGKGMLTAPWTRAVAAVVLGRDQVIARVENAPSWRHCAAPAPEQ